jgi:hypothetical protein
MHIQCLIKRKGGSKPDFGHHEATKVTYHFKPLDPKDEDSPHVCDVNNDDHIAAFLAIPSTYRIYKQGEKLLEVPKPTQVVDTSALKNRYDDLLSVDAELVDGVWLEGFAREVLDIDPKNRALLKECLENDYNGKVKGNPSTNNMIRSILIAKIAQEQAASDLHVKGDTTEVEKAEGVKDGV